jgi:ribosomal-protein-alanine N-acetyltransferase
LSAAPDTAAETRLRIEQMRVSDLLQVAEIERKCFLNPWGLNAFVAEFLNGHSHRLVARWSGAERVVAFAICWFAAGEVHINNLAVHPEYRRRGVAERLLEAILEQAERAGAGLALLEVRPSNEAALALYRKFGFRRLGRRRGYYADNGEDAWVLGRRLTAAGPGSLRVGEDDA